MKVSLAYAEQQLRHWTKKVEELCLTSNAFDAKEEGKGKENASPTPPIREKGKGEESLSISTRARGSSGFRPSIEEIAAFVKEIGSDIDPEYFWRYYNSNHRRWPREWRDRLRNWTANGA